MQEPTKDKSIDPNGLPQKDAFDKKEVFQHKQPADSGKVMDDKTADNTDSAETIGKQQQKSKNEEGLNEERSEGNAGAFEGFEDHQK